MTTFYLDVSAIGNEYQAYSDTPTTWAVPQDGNGKAGPGHSAAVAIGTIDCASASASGAGQLAVLGVTVSTTLTGSGATLATNIAAAINAAATAVGGSYSAALLPLNRLVYARVNPGVSTEVQIMLRIAGADWNGMTHTSAGTWGTAPTMGAFAGGANGPFGYLLNVSAPAFGKTGGANSTPNWGIGVAKSGGVTEPTEADPIRVRTKRSGASLTLTHLSNSNTVIYWLCPSGSTRTYVFDDGSAWSGDNGSLLLFIDYSSGSGSTAVQWNGNLNLLAAAKYGFEIRYRSSTTMNIAIKRAAGNFVAEQILFKETSDTLGFLDLAWFVAADTNPAAELYRCKFSHKAVGKTVNWGNPSGGSSACRFIECDFEYGAETTGIVSMTYFSGVANCELIACNFIDRNSISVPVLKSPVSGTPPGLNFRILFDGCSGVAPFVAGIAATWANRHCIVSYRMPGIDGAWRTETGTYITEWRDGANIPYLNGLLRSGTPWSIKTLWRYVNYALADVQPVTLNPMYRGTSAIKTITVEALVPTGSSFTKDKLGLSITYTKPDGTTVSESTFSNRSAVVLAGGTALDTSTASWSMNGTSGYDKVKLSLTTTEQIASGTRVVVRLQMRGNPPGNTDRTVFIDPEPAFT